MFRLKNNRRITMKSFFKTMLCLVSASVVIFVMSACGAKTTGPAPKVAIDLGSSSLYTQEELKDAILLIKDNLKKDTISAKHVSPHPDTDSEHRIEYGNQRMSSVIRMTAACGGTGTTFRFARNVVTASSTALFPDLLTMDVLTTLPSFPIVSSTMGQFVTLPPSSIFDGDTAFQWG